MGWIDVPLFDPTNPIGASHANAILSLNAANKDAVAKKLLTDTLAIIRTIEAKELRENADVQASNLPAAFTLFAMAVPAPRSWFTSATSSAGLCQGIAPADPCNAGERDQIQPSKRLLRRRTAQLPQR